ncbi:uncharacterized protein LOC126195327 isoform X1 [Schistocerca nitens]|uniref:uncharacterized protein LOC126195327 isoform X1 n=1 Tax=Schistocerca nitens TaxID=7011 RepID=UPI002117DC2E|nr:uncharacterized protein LOC126195327 isoform X1 [Schistocerca nitens]
MASENLMFSHCRFLQLWNESVSLLFREQMVTINASFAGTVHSSGTPEGTGDRRLCEGQGQRQGEGQAEGPIHREHAGLTAQPPHRSNRAGDAGVTGGAAAPEVCSQDGFDGGGRGADPPAVVPVHHQGSHRQGQEEEEVARETGLLTAYSDCLWSTPQLMNMCVFVLTV